MKTIRRFAAYAALPLLLASSFNANAAYVAVDSFTTGATDMDFETAGGGEFPATGWWTPNSELWSQTTDKASTGSGSMRCCGNAGGGTRIQGPVSIPNAGTFKLSFDVYIDSSVSADRLTWINAVFYEGWHDLGIDLSSVAKDEWVTIETAAFTYDKAVATDLWMKVTASAGDILFYMDNLQLLEYVEGGSAGSEDVEGNLITNSDMAGFELEGAAAEGGASGWWTGSPAVWKRSTEQAANGSAASLQCSFDVASFAGAFIQNSGTNPIEIPVVGKYKLSFYVYVDGSANEALDHVNMIMKGTDTWIDAPIDLTSVEKDTWVLIEQEYEFAKSLPTAEFWIKMDPIGTGSGNVNFYLDDMSLVYVDAVDGMAATDEATVAVGAAAGEIVIAGAADGEQVTVYSVTGSVVANTVATTGRVSVPAASGIYIVKVGSEVVKVAL